MKFNSKLLIVTFVLFLLLFTTICFGTNYDDQIMLISDTNQYDKQVSTENSDLYILNESEYEISNIINGNVFATVDTLNIVPNNNGGIIQGNLFVTAESVNIKSDAVYSDTEKDSYGNPIITINKTSAISGNVFSVSNKFVLEPGSEINGDLYVYADEVILEQNSKVNGNIFVFSEKFDLNAEVGGNLYASTKSFNMKYFGFISRDLYLIAEDANLNGWIYRNSFITSKNLQTQDKFINQGDFTVKDADNLIFSGEVLGNATINTKNITFKNKENDKDLSCKIAGNLSYSSKQETQVPEGIALKEINYSNYIDTSSKNVLSNILDFVLSLIGLLILAYIIYIIIYKFAPNYLDKISNISGLSLLKYLGIGLGFLILIPIISILLLITKVGATIGLILLLIYITLLLISKPIFIIGIARFAKNKLKKNLNIYLYILGINVILSLITLIPYVGFVISMLVNLTGFGIIIKNLISIKK